MHNFVRVLAVLIEGLMEPWDRDHRVCGFHEKDRRHQRIQAGQDRAVLLADAYRFQHYVQVILVYFRELESVFIVPADEPFRLGIGEQLKILGVIF